ncbi:MAG: hypothetical protein WDN46_04525 [Methylocella sp.]
MKVFDLRRRQLIEKHRDRTRVRAAFFIKRGEVRGADQELAQQGVTDTAQQTSGRPRLSAEAMKAAKPSSVPVALMA